MNNSIGNIGGPRPVPQGAPGRIGPQQNNGHNRGHEQTERFQRRHNQGPAFREAQMRRHETRGGDPTTGGDDVAGSPELTETEKAMLLQVLFREVNAVREANRDQGPPPVDVASISSDGLDALAADGQRTGGGRMDPSAGGSDGSGDAGVQRADPTQAPPADNGGVSLADPVEVPPPGGAGVERADPVQAPPADSGGVNLADPVEVPPPGSTGVERADPVQAPPVDDAPRRPSFTVRRL